MGGGKEEVSVPAKEMGGVGEGSGAQAGRVVWRWRRRRRGQCGGGRRVEK